MRLIDVDALIPNVKTLADYDWNDTRRMAYKDFLDILTNAPTAYDVEKVVAELEALKKPPFIDSPYHTGFICGVNYAINIVKKGDVT